MCATVGKPTEPIKAIRTAFSTPCGSETRNSAVIPQAIALYHSSKGFIQVMTGSALDAELKWSFEKWLFLTDAAEKCWDVFVWTWLTYIIENTIREKNVKWTSSLEFPCPRMTCWLHTFFLLLRAWWYIERVCIEDQPSITYRLPSTAPFAELDVANMCFSFKQTGTGSLEFL